MRPAIARENFGFAALFNSFMALQNLWLASRALWLSCV
jgi:nitroreductase